MNCPYCKQPGNKIYAHYLLTFKCNKHAVSVDFSEYFIKLSTGEYGSKYGDIAVLLDFEAKETVILTKKSNEFSRLEIDGLLNINPDNFYNKLKTIITFS